MSNTKREALLSDDGITKMVPEEADFYDCELTGHRVREVYEAARAKDAELIQMLVDACRTAYLAIDSLNDSGMGPLTSIEGARAMSDTVDALAAAEAAGFKPSGQ